MKKFIKKIYARLSRQKKINAIHADLNSVVLDLQVLTRSDDEAFKKAVVARAMNGIRNTKLRMLDLGLEYQG